MTKRQARIQALWLASGWIDLEVDPESFARNGPNPPQTERELAQVERILREIVGGLDKRRRKLERLERFYARQDAAGLGTAGKREEAEAARSTLAREQGGAIMKFTLPIHWSRRRGRKLWHVAVASDPTGCVSDFTACGRQFCCVEDGEVEQATEWPDGDLPRPSPQCRACLRWLAGQDPANWREPAPAPATLPSADAPPPESR
jgi:hypothetical protein